MIDDDSFPPLTEVQQDIVDRLTSEIADETRQMLVGLPVAVVQDSR